MKTSWIWTLSFLLFLNGPLRAADANAAPRLTVELRDGSRLVGASTAGHFSFHSDLLGDLKLDVKDLRSVECLSSNQAKITTAAGDTLTVSFNDSAVGLKAAFGTVDVAVESIRKFSVSGGGAARPSVHPPGLVALWSAEGDARDSVGGNNGKMAGTVNFVPGEIGQAFSLADLDSYVKIPSSPALNVGAGSGFTLSAWINPTDASGHQPIFEWSMGDGSYWGVHFFIDSTSFQTGTGTLYANIVDSAGPWHQIHTPPGAVSAGVFQQVALTYDQPTGVARIYCNGIIVAQQAIGSFKPKTSDDLYLGHRPLTANEIYTFAGALDELAIYNRALSPREIQDQCQADNGGELPPPPPIPTPGIIQGRPPFLFNQFGE